VPVVRVALQVPVALQALLVVRVLAARVAKPAATEP
jgi:hypothetical protein